MNKKTRIYVDTSVIGGCFDPEFELWSKGLFEDFKTGIFIPVISEIVTAEIADAPKEVISKFSELLEFNYKQISIYSPREVTKHGSEDN